MRKGVVRLAYLIAHGANVNERFSNGLTPLHIAAVAGQEAVVELLLDKGADPDVRDDFGKTPYDLAFEHG